MRLYEFGTGKIVKGVNTTADVGVDEISKQAKKFGNSVDNEGNPPVNPSGKINLKEAVDYNWTYDTTARFKIGTMIYNVDFLPIYNGADDEYDVEFSAVHGPRFGNNKEMGQSSIQVFGTVIKIIEDFIKKNKPAKLVFVGEKADNRVNLYTKLINKFKSELEAENYSVDIANSEKDTKFTISKNTQINELFDSSISTKLNHIEDNKAEGKFSIGDQHYTVEFTPVNTGDYGEAIDISFYADGHEREDGFKYGLTDTGNQFKVLKAVADLIIHYMNRFEPNIAVFDAYADEPSRVKLYDKGVKLISNNLSEYKLKIEKLNYLHRYVFTKKQLTEAPIKLGKTGADEGSPAKMFIDKFNEITDENPLNHRQRVSGLAKAELYALGNTTIRLSDIQGQGGGAGTKLMNLICTLADEYDVRIKLLAYGYETIPTDKLVSWYKRFGFESMSEFEEDDEGVEMMRDPK